MTGLRKYLTSADNWGQEDPGQDRSGNTLRLLLAAGFAASLLLLVYKEFFRPDLANPVAEAATVLMFASALLFLTRNWLQVSVNMVFFIPLIAGAYYLADFSNSEPPAGTVILTLAWLVCGMLFLALFSPGRKVLLLFFLAGTGTLFWHGEKADLLAVWFSTGQVLVSNPLLLFLFFTLLAAGIRRKYDLDLERSREERQTLEQQLKELFQHFRHPMAHIRAERDPGGNITRLTVRRINYSFESGFKITRAEARDQEINHLFGHLFRNDTPWNDWLIIHPVSAADLYSPRHERWFNLHFLWAGDNDCLCLFYDVTAKEKAIRKLEDSKARYLALLEAIPDIFFVLERDGTFQDVVFKDQEKFYPETSEIIGNTIFGVGFTGAMSEKLYQCIGKAIDDDTLETLEYSLKTGELTLLFEMRLARLSDHSVVAIARDITRRKKAEFELEIARARAEEADALKSHFLANLSHDIRTPVNIITGLTKMLAEEALREDERENLLQDVQLQGNLLTQMIENTIQLSKIETNTLEVNFVYTDIHRLLRELYHHFFPLVPDNRDLQFTTDPMIQHGEVGFETDPHLLKEALGRLIDNALKFTREGIVRFGYTAAAGNSVLFYVEDTGPGIPLEEKENIFLRFYVLEKDRKAQKSGPGLGLPIAQHFVALLGGELSVDTIPGKGSRFWFRLPLINARGFLRIV